MQITYNFLKHSEGGLTQKDAIAIAKSCGARKAVCYPSILIGHTAMTVEAPKAVHRKIENRLY